MANTTPFIDTSNIDLSQFLPLESYAADLLPTSGKKYYIDENGNFVWKDPTVNNPVPVTDVPGATLKPTTEYKDIANQVKAFTDMMPYLSEALNSEVLPTALANYQASATTSPLYAELMTNLYNTYGSQLNAIENEIDRRNAISQAQTDTEVLKNYGPELVQSAYDLSQIYDKPYYDTRQTTSDAVNNLINSIDLSGALSTTERDEIAKGLAREGSVRGTANAPSNLETVANAMQYGSAGTQRKQQAQNALTSAISASSDFLKNAKSGVDVFQVATGKPSTSNNANNVFTGVTSEDGNTSALSSLGSNLMSGMTNLQITKDQQSANEKDWLDMMNQVTSSMSDLGSMFGGLI